MFEITNPIIQVLSICPCIITTSEITINFILPNPTSLPNDELKQLKLYLNCRLQNPNMIHFVTFELLLLWNS